MVKVAFIGGGPGGLIAAYLLQQKCDAPCDITVFEASERVGGKIATRSFASAAIFKYWRAVGSETNFSSTAWQVRSAQS